MSKVHIIPDWMRLEESCILAENWDAAFEYNDFFQPDILDDSEELKKRIEKYRSLQRNKTEDTLHGTFFDLCINSQDKKIAEVSRMRMRQCMEVAAALEVRGVVFHTNTISGFRIKGYEENWLKCHEEFIRRLFEEYQGISIYMENMFDQSPELLKKLAIRLKDTNFRVCFDVAHANLTRITLQKWFEELAPYIGHMHINDNDGVMDLHQPVGQGKIDWKNYQNLIECHNVNSGVLVEVSSLIGAEMSLQYMKENGIYPFEIN